MCNQNYICTYKGERMKLHPLASVPAMVQNVEHDWQKVVGKIAVLAMKDDITAIEMGDCFVQIEKSFGKKYLQEAAAQAGVSWSVAKQRHWVSTKIPVGNELRKTLGLEKDKNGEVKPLLSFSHLRTIAGTEDMSHWVEQCLDNEWSVSQLKTEIEKAGDVAAQVNGDPCIQCEESLQEDAEIVSFTVGRKKRARCCSVKCAAKYFRELEEDEGSEGNFD